MKWLLIGGAVLVGLIGLIVLIGAVLPQSHVASIARDYDAEPASVWRAITEVERFAEWRPDLQQAERLPVENGKERWRETSKHDAMTIEVTESIVNQRMVTRIADEGLPFGGSWTYELKPVDRGTRLTITERGEVYNPVFRFVSRFVMGHTATIETYHAGLAKRLAAAK
jgi:uncharacterized protein YndB with AHSA1/START domain